MQSLFDETRRRASLQSLAEDMRLRVSPLALQRGLCVPEARRRVIAEPRCRGLLKSLIAESHCIASWMCLAEESRRGESRRTFWWLGVSSQSLAEETRCEPSLETLVVESCCRVSMNSLQDRCRIQSKGGSFKRLVVEARSSVALSSLVEESRCRVSRKSRRRLVADSS